MSRQSMAPPRALSLTEELEKLEQSITLTLQEIDSNFAKAHRIVTSSILPIVDRYAKNSDAVWEGSKFWKQFFEASGNVSFNNYAVPAIEDSMINTGIEDDNDTSEADMDREDTSTDVNADKADESEDVTITSPRITTNIEHSDDDDPILSSPSLAHNQSTPKARPTTGKTKEKARHHSRAQAQVADDTSEYETIKRELRGEKHSAAKNAPVTPGKRAPALPDMTMTPQGSSPFGLQPQSAMKRAHKDQVLHQGMLGMTYRVAATPMTAKKAWLEPGSSPLGEEPQLRPEVFSSPAKPALSAAKKPGLSVMSPMKKENIERHREERRRSLKQLTGRTIFRDDGEESSQARAQLTMRSKMGWDSDDDEMPEFSPPKTLRFEFGEAKIIQTPAREASQRIVEDLYADAGGDFGEVAEEYSPSIVVKSTNYRDDTF